MREKSWDLRQIYPPVLRRSRPLTLFPLTLMPPGQRDGWAAAVPVSAGVARDLLLHCGWSFWGLVGDCVFRNAFREKNKFQISVNWLLYQRLESTHKLGASGIILPRSIICCIGWKTEVRLSNFLKRFRDRNDWKFPDTSTHYSSHSTCTLLFCSYINWLVKKWAKALFQVQFSVRTFFKRPFGQARQ